MEKEKEKKKDQPRMPSTQIIGFPERTEKYWSRNNP